jgi:beta-glucosidase
MPSSATASPSKRCAPRGPAGTKIGFAENIRVAIPIMDSPEYVEAAEKATREGNAGFMTVMLEGRYTDAYLAEAGGDSPKFTDDELKTIASPLDFVGINVYKPGWYVEPSAEPPGYHDIPVNASHPEMQSSWHVLDPEVMYWASKQMQSIWGAKSIFITENGCGASDAVAEDGRVYDSDRVMFLRACLGQLQRATSEGVPVDGYFLWSAQDNFEWMDGFGNRFGLIYVDFDTLERTPKLSAEWFREAARQVSAGSIPWSALAVEWGAIAVWISAFATFLAVIVAALVALGYFDWLRGPRIPDHLRRHRAVADNADTGTKSLVAEKREVTTSS